MSTSPRIESAIPGRSPDLAGALMHAPRLAAGFAALYAEYWQSEVTDLPLKEMTRIRNARITDCGY